MKFSDIGTWINHRLREPSTYIGLSLVVNGVGAMAKLDAAPAVADGINQVGVPLSQGDWTTALLLAAGGIAGIVVKEKGKKAP